MSQPETTFEPCDRRIAAALGALAFIVYLLSASLNFHSIDEIAIFSVSRSLAARGSFDGDILFWTQPALGFGSIVADGSDGHTYVVKDAAPAILATPLVWSASRLAISPIHAALLLNPLITALTVSLIHYVIHQWGYGRITAIVGALTLAFASMAWPYAETLFTQPLAALGLLIVLYAVTIARERQRWQAALIGGMGLGLAGLSAVPTWVSLPFYLLYLLPWDALRARDWRLAVTRAVPLVGGFAVGATIFVLLQALYNMLRFGSPLQTGYQQVGASSISPVYLATGFLGSLISTPRGIIWYAPFVLLIPFGLWIGLRTSQRGRMLLAAAQVAIIFILYSSYATWWAGLSWGPRFFTAIMPALTLLTIPAFDGLLHSRLSWKHILAAALWLVSFVTQFLAATFDYLDSETLIARSLLKMTPPSFMEWKLLLSDPMLLPIPRQIAAAQMGKWDVWWVQGGRVDAIRLGVGCMVAPLIVTMIWQAQRGKSSRLATALPVGLAMLFAVLMLFRAPAAAYESAGLEPVIETITERAQSGDAVLSLLPSSYLGWLEHYDSRLPDTGVVFEAPLSERSADMLEALTARHDCAWLVSEETTGANPDNGVEVWLAEHGYIGTEVWIEGFRIVPYTFAHDAPAQAYHQRFADQIELGSASVQVHDERWINVALRWKPLQPITVNYSVFVHLIDANGSLVGQHDGQPAAGYLPTSSWQSGMMIEDRHSILLPAELPPGDYTLVVGLYDPNTGERLRDASGADAFTLQVIRLE
jgi:hypothetical protein